MPTLFVDGHIEIDAAVAGGKPRIAGHRISVQDVVIWHERMGRTADEIASDYGLSLADVHAALAYYFDHRDLIDHSISDSDAFVEGLKLGMTSKLAAKTRKPADDHAG